MILWISEGNVHAPVIGKMSIPGLMFADDLAIGSFSQWCPERD
jgi:hypothetical protein